MKTAFALFVFLLGVPLGAQTFEVGLFAGQQKYPTADFPGRGPAPGSRETLDNKTVYAARLGYSVADLGPVSFQLTAGLQPESTSAVHSTATTSTWDFKEHHWSAGAMVNLKALVALGAGFEFRSERLSGNEIGRSSSTTYNRVWARLNAGYAIPSLVVKPFFGVEVAFPLKTMSGPLGSYTTPTDELKMLAPKHQLGVYAGIRF